MKRLSIIAGLSGACLANPAFAEAGLPQLDAALFPEQLFWWAITFGILYLVMRYFALPGVQKVQENRKDIITRELAAAKQANQQAKAMWNQSDKSLTEARAKANATISNIKAEASKKAAEQQAAQGKQLQARTRDAETAINAARATALKEIEASAADLATAIVESVSGNNNKVRA